MTTNYKMQYKGCDERKRNDQTENHLSNYNFYYERINWDEVIQFLTNTDWGGNVQEW